VRTKFTIATPRGDTGAASVKRSVSSVNRSQQARIAGSATGTAAGWRDPFSRMAWLRSSSSRWPNRCRTMGRTNHPARTAIDSPDSGLTPAAMALSIHRHLMTAERREPREGLLATRQPLASWTTTSTAYTPATTRPQPNRLTASRACRSPRLSMHPKAATGMAATPGAIWCITPTVPASPGDPSMVLVHISTANVRTIRRRRGLHLVMLSERMSQLGQPVAWTDSARSNSDRGAWTRTI
jgi:hypothetical protein